MDDNIADFGLHRRKVAYEKLRDRVKVGAVDHAAAGFAAMLLVERFPAFRPSQSDSN